MGINYNDPKFAKAQSKANSLISEAEGLIREAESLADEFGFTLSWDLAYGMGGVYYPSKAIGEDDWAESGWNSSSSSC